MLKSVLQFWQFLVCILDYLFLITAFAIHHFRPLRGIAGFEFVRTLPFVSVGLVLTHAGTVPEFKRIALR